MKSLAFITPVHERYALTRIGFAQRRWVCDELKKRYGLDATVIVVGDDDNLDVAREFGFLAVEHSNWATDFAVNNGKPFVALGMKFNAGYNKAHKAGIDLVFPIGSDSWIDPVYFDTLPERGELLLSRAYNIVVADTSRRGALWIGWEGGVQWITHTEDWEHRKYQPVSPSLSKGCDTSTWAHKRADLKLNEQHHHQLEYVAFQSPTEQITSYPTIMARYGTGEVKGERVLGDLEEHYRAEDIRALKIHYAHEQFAVVERRLALMNAEMNEELAEAERLAQVIETLEAAA